MELSELRQDINKIDEEDIIYLKNYLEVLGYRLERLQNTKLQIICLCFRLTEKKKL